MWEFLNIQVLITKERERQIITKLPITKILPPSGGVLFFSIFVGFFENTLDKITFHNKHDCYAIA